MQILTRKNIIEDMSPSLMYLIKRVVVLFYIADYIWRGYSGLWVCQLEGNPMVNIGYNPLFMLYGISGIEEFIVSRFYIALSFDLLLLLSWVCIWIRPAQKWWQILAAVLFFIYSVISPVHMAYAAHYLSGMVIMNFLFLFHRTRTFSYVWEGIRFYICFVYGSAFLWKVINGAMWSPADGVQVIRNNLGQYLLLNPDTGMAEIYSWLLRNPLWVGLGTVVTYLMEGFFLVGFFTKKYDLVLIWLILLIHFVINIVVDTSFIEWYIFVFPFISISAWQQWQRQWQSYHSAGNP